LPTRRADEQIAGELIEPNLLDRIQRYAREWCVVVEDSFETESSVIAFGTRDVDALGTHVNQAVVLKVVKQPGDEWRSGEILEAFDGNGVARVHTWAPGAVLMERLRPGNSLVDMALDGRDEDATDILAGVIQQMSGHESARPPLACASIQDWGKGFERYIATGNDQIPMDLVEAAHRVCLSLCATQREPKLLHGDLQHYNVLFDSGRGWLAIDPKGVIGELEFEIGAVLRNPVERPELFLSRATIESRIKQFASKLHLDYERALAWGFAQAVLSAIWDIEDGFVVDATHPSLRLANALRPMLAAECGRYTG
jgi:streptomycin 6-kinase